MKEIEQDPKEECSRATQRTKQNDRKFSERYREYQPERSFASNWAMREYSGVETSEGSEESTDSNESSQTRTRRLERKTKSRAHSNKRGKYTLIENRKQNMRKILENLISLVEKEDDDKETEDNFWDYKVPNRS